MSKKELKQTVGEFWFDEKTENLHIKTRTGYDSTKWRNLEQEIEKNLEKHFKNDN